MINVLATYECKQTFLSYMTQLAVTDKKKYVHNYHSIQVHTISEIMHILF